MTTEEKYKEALERAKKFEEKYGGDYAGYIFPKLAESEDERIRKRLIEYFEGFRIGNAKVKWEGLTVQDVLAWLEKQKENPKSADSIPSDCTSDAKCEDRWHKVGDSLPDNGRLVLAKDCLGNVLLARYDGENWEVNVYDNEDHYCHNSISKWCEIPSEKQKEQKPAEVDERMKNDKHFLSICQHLGTLISESKNDGAEESINKDYRWLCEFYRKSRSASVEENYKKPAEWSEEDEEILNRIIETLSLPPIYDTKACAKMVSWLKSLRPSWKPSEEQMEALLNTLHPDDPYYHDLKSLYEQLKKLM